MMPRPLCVSLLIITALTLLGSAASAQRVSLSEGVAPPYSTIVDRDDALSLELNPAGLSHIKGTEVTALMGLYADSLNEGFGVLAGTQLFNGLGLGFGAQFILPGVVEDEYRKYTLGLGMGGNISVGVAANLFGSSRDEAIDDLVTWDLGVQWRLMRWLGLGLAIRDANAPFLDGAPIEPQLVAGLALRSLEGRVMLEADAIFTGGARVRPRLVAAVEPFSGFKVFGQAIADTGVDGNELDLTEFTVGLETNLANLGLSGSGTAGEGASGFSGALRMSTAGWRPVFGNGKRFHRVRIGGNPSERTPVGVLGQPMGRSFLSILRQIERMREDPDVEGMVLELKGVSMGYGQAWELRESLRRFRQSDKPIVAFMHSPSHREYYIASIANHVYQGPSGTFNARGIAITSAYYRGALDKLGVKADFIRIKEYKSAPESFMREAPSEPAQEALTAFLDSIWDTQTTEIGGARGLSPEQVNDLINTAPHDPGAAEQAGLIDGVIYEDELKETLRDLYGKSSRIKNTYGSLQKDYAWGSKPAVLVLHIDGTIVQGSGGTNPLLGDVMSGSSAIEKLAKWAASSPSVKAVVLRVDSPGGSAIASDLMYRSLKKLAEKKPLIVSMGDIAASGGYYVSAAGESIFCNPTTLTGSIGIYSGKFALEGLMAKVGYSTYVTKHGDRADLYDLAKPWDTEERQVILDQITYLYELFLSQVSTGRQMSRDEVHNVARGRIWSGVDAQKVGLCDQQGGILDAIEHAREKAGIDADDMTVISAPKLTSLGPLIPSIGLNVDLGQLAALDHPDLPRLEGDDQAALMDAYAPLRTLIAPLRPAIDLGVIFEDGEALAMLPFSVDFD